MKKTLSLWMSLVMILSMFSGLNFTAFAEETSNDSTDTSFPYSDSDVYVADSIVKGIIDREGVAHGSSEISMALLHNYTYHNLSEALIDDGALVFDSLFWQNLKSTLSGDFLNIANWQEEMYILLIIDYLNYYSQSAEFESNFEKNTVKFTEDIYKNVIKYTNNEYLDKVDDLIKNQSLSDAVALSEKWGIVNKLNKYNSVLGDIKTVSNTAVDYYKNLSKALSVQKADESRIEFLKQMKKAGSDNYYFVSAVNNVISMYESSYSSLAFAEGSKTMLKHGMSVLFSEAKKACPEAAAIIDGLKIYTEGLNWLFNSDDISKNNLKLIIVYTIGSYATSAVRSLRDTYVSTPTKDNANEFISGYIGYLKYQEYASNSTIGFVSSALFDGVVNQIKNIFSDENEATYNEFKKYLNNDIDFCERLEKLIEKQYNLYFAIVGYTSTVLTDNDVTDDLTEIDSSNIYSDEITYNFLISGQSVISKDFQLTNDLTICGDLYLKGGTLDLNGHTLTVNGNLYQSGGEMYIDGGTLNVGGDYRIQTYQLNNATDEMEFVQSSGCLVMNNTYDLVKIRGSFYTQSKESSASDISSASNKFSAGTMEVGGDLYQISKNASVYNFRCYNNHKIIFNGIDEQKVHFDSSFSQINQLEVQNSNITWSGYMRVLQFKSDANIKSNNLTINKINTNKNDVTINGDIFMNGDTVDLYYGSLTVTGNLYQSGGEMYIDGGTLNVGGDYRIQTYQLNNATDEMEFVQSSGCLVMNNTYDLVKIRGSFYTQSKESSASDISSASNKFSAGTMEVGGDLYQISKNASVYNFRCYNNHKVILNGNNIQTIHFDSTYSCFNILKLTKDKTTGYIFEPDNCWKELYLDTDVKKVSIVAPAKTIKQCDSMQLSAKVDGINNPSQDVIWSISGNTDSQTTISDKGILSVSLNEKAKQITVTATSVADNTKSASVTIAIEEIVPVVNGIAINPSVASTVCGQSCQFNAVVLGFYNPSQSVIWSISGNKSSNTKIDSNGLLTIANDETSKKITVKAVSSADKTITASVTVDVMQIKIISTVDNVTITMETGETQQLKAVVTGTNNPSQKVVWSVSGNNSENTVITDNGEISIGNDETSSMIIVKAVSAEDSSKYGEFAISIKQNILIGDVNGDEDVTVDDVTSIQMYLSGIISLTDSQLAVSDINGDGDITVDDATIIQMYLAGIITSY